MTGEICLVLEYRAAVCQLSQFHISLLNSVLLFDVPAVLEGGAVGSTSEVSQAAVTVTSCSPCLRQELVWLSPEGCSELAETELLHRQGPWHRNVPAAGDVGQQGQGESLRQVGFIHTSRLM